MPPEPAESGRLEISLRQVQQLFNSLDPAPFHERELDLGAETYLLSWVQELPAEAALELSLHLTEAPPPQESPHWIEDAVHHHFAERERLKRRELRALLRQGRVSLAIGLAFLAVCLLLSRWLLGLGPDGVLASLLRESFLVAGWVALWRPLQIYLYDWWPLLGQARLLRRMSAMPVRVVVGAAAPQSGLVHA